MTTHSMHHDPSAAQLAVAAYEEEQRTRHQQQQRRNVKLYAVGRMFLSVLFMASGAAKLVDYGATVQALDGVVAGASIILPLVIALELIGGVLLFLGIQARRVSIGLIGWLAVVTLFMHHDLTNPLNRAFALMNMAFAGALLMIVAHGAGALSFERIFRGKA